jgi:hypothetical protein
MKIQPKIVLLSLLSIACLLIATSGCGTAGGIFTKTATVTPAAVVGVTPIVTNANQGVIADYPTAMPLPAGSTVLSTNQNGTLHVEVPPNVTIAYQVSPKTTTTLQTGEAIAGAVPAPYGTLAILGLTALSGVLGIFAKLKSGQAASAQEVADLVNPIIAGVESVGNPATKLAIQQHAVAAGVQDVLDPLVQAVSKQMPVCPPGATTCPMPPPAVAVKTG